MAHDLIRLLHCLFLPAAKHSCETCWQPSADIYRTHDGWLVKFDLAGVRPEDVKFSIHGNRLTIQGTRRDWSLEEGSSHHHMEIAYNQFERSISVPADLTRCSLGVEHREGMLLVRIQREADQS